MTTLGLVLAVIITICALNPKTFGCWLARVRASYDKEWIKGI